MATDIKDITDDKASKIAELETKLVEMENNWKRALADYKNFQNRVQEERASALAFANEALVWQLLSVLDSIEKLHGHLSDEGLKIVAKEFKQVLTNVGLEEMTVENAQFDPTKMEAVDMIEGEKNMVVETVQKGYFLNGKLLRPARVKVGSGATSSENQEEK